MVNAVLVYAQHDIYQFETIDTRKGLSNNQITSIYKDEKGFMWFGTLAGLNRYDGHQFKVFKHKTGDSTSINDNYITQMVQGPGLNMWVLTPAGWNIFDPRTETFTANTADFLAGAGNGGDGITGIVKDSKADFWLVCPGRGVYKYVSATRQLRVFNSSSSPNRIYSNNVTALTIDRAGFIWMVYADGMLEKMNPEGRIVYKSAALQTYSNRQNLVYGVFADADNDLWIYSLNEAKGIYYFNPLKNVLLPIHKDSKDTRLNNNIVNSVVQDDRGLIWIATDHGGLNLLNKKNFSVRYLTNNETNPKSLSQNSVTAAFKDDNGIIWLGTFKKGINQYHENNVRFPLYQHQPGNPESLAYNDVNKFAEDSLGNIWIGTNGGGLIYFNRKAGTFRQYVHDRNDPNSLTNNVIVSLCIDHQKKLWIGTYYGGMDCFDGRKFTHYRHDVNNPASLADDRVWEIFEDSRQRLWVGTLREGLDLFDRKSATFKHYRSGTAKNAMRSLYVSSLVEDKAGNIWIGTDMGVAILDNFSGQFRQLEHVEGEKSSLSNNTVIEILQDSRGLIWVSTRDGLNLYDAERKKFTRFGIEDGLPDNSILTLLEDNNRNIWVTTPNGLCNIIVTAGAGSDVKLQFKNYDETDGLQGRQFNENAALKTATGELVVGGANGFNVFMPSKITDNKAVSKIILTDLQVFNNTVKIGEMYNGRVVLPVSISEAREVRLAYNQNVFTVEFATLNFKNSDKVKYAYKLEGFNTGWLTTDARNRKATFTNLNAGSYTLLIKASNEDGVWSTEPYSLTINILPPFWLTPYAFAVYVLLIIAALFFARRIILRRARAKFKLEHERQEAQRLHELDMMKIKFFTNVSHEFRTPLSLIILPVEKLLQATANQDDQTQFQLIYRNARRLLNLVNQLLDFRKLEEQELQLNKTPGDIIRFIKELSVSFSDVAERKNINLSFHAEEHSLYTAFDHDKLERILFNLLSNAFKFTPAGGTVSVALETGTTQGGKILSLKVIDSGIGISKDKHERIFERFFQNDIPGSMVNQGSGIGLAITKEFVRMHGGAITVNSEENKGSCFTVTLPVVPVNTEISNAPEAMVTGIAIAETPENTTVARMAESKTNESRKKKVLLVEDNDDFRFYLKDNLKAYFNIIEAPNGKLGWQLTLAEHPDIVVCDISMPEMNGIELSRKIKGDDRTAFIPVILLTALTGEDQQLTGLQTGASDYMTKPFNFEILLSKIRNLITQQERFKKTYQKQVHALPNEVIGQSADEKFMHTALALVEKNISNADFSVEEMSRELFMSRVALYKKLFALSGQTPIEFIRFIRLQRAAQLLKKNELTVAEVAYEVGFNNPKNFSRYFKAAYNVLPSAYAGQEPSDVEKASGESAG